MDLYLYDLHEVVGATGQSGRVPVRQDGRQAGVRAPQRWYALSYLLTCWTSRPEDEHALLSSCLLGLLRRDVLPPDWLGPGVSDRRAVRARRRAAAADGPRVPRTCGPRSEGSSSRRWT